ncbi:MAG: polysaccharide biosynthesis C-terminal domain-containing protein, partial [Anaerolineae bacterium]|nr:polysaccharide biosynthesis C-terminal domain-containing protein [Anaerolineae bacterium]
DIPFNVYHAFGGAVANSMKGEKKVSNIFIVLSILNFFLNLILIIPLGMIGASFATVLTDMWGAAQFYFMFRYRFGAGLQFRNLIRLAVAAIIMGIVAYWLSHLALIASFGKWGSLITIIGISAVVYLVLAWFSGAFTTQEREQFVRLAVRGVGMVRRKLGFAT